MVLFSIRAPRLQISNGPKEEGKKEVALFTDYYALKCEEGFIITY